MSLLFDKLCENRGYDVRFFDDIFSSEHGLPMNVDVLAHRLYEYRLSLDQIVILTDFDLDGICAGVIAYGGLAELGFNVSLYRPDTRLGYGFTAYTIDDLVAMYPNVRAILTGDVGISCLSGIQRAKDLGLEIFVTDHHLGSLDTGADITVDPNAVEESDTDSYPLVCGSVVMYTILRYYAEHYTKCPGFVIQQIDRLRVFAGLATVSDSMPVYYENRNFIKDAVSMCQFLYSGKSLDVVNMIPGCDVYRRMFFGLYEILAAFDEAGKFQSVWSIDEDFFGYYIAPMFNSIKRMSYDVNLAYSVFFGGTEIAKQSVEKLFQLNDARKALVAQKYAELFEIDQPWESYVYITDAPVGVRGLLAQKLLDSEFGPVLVLAKDSDGVYRGSGRSPEWYPYLELSGVDEQDRWGAAGHNPAFGVYVQDEDALTELVAHLCTTVAQVKPNAENLKFVPDFVVGTVGKCDSDLDIAHFKSFLRDVRLCRPFGPGFPSPQILLRFRSSEAAWMLLGSESQHVKLLLPGGLPLLCFNQGVGFCGTIHLDKLPDVIEVVGALSYNEFNGSVSVQFIGTFLTDIFADYDVDFADNKGDVVHE